MSAVNIDRQDEGM